MSDDTIGVKVWLYGDLKKYGGQAAELAHARLDLELAAGTRMRDLLYRIVVFGSIGYAVGGKGHHLYQRRSHRYAWCRPVAPFDTPVCPDCRQAGDRQGSGQTTVPLNYNLQKGKVTS